MKHLSALGQKITSQAKVVQEQTQFISSETDIKLFINENRTTQDMPNEVNLETLNPNEDFENHMSQQLAKQLELEEQEHLAKVQEEEKDLSPPERVRRHLFNLVIENMVLTPDELSYILSQLETVEARQQLSEFL